MAGSESQTNEDQTSGAGFTASAIKHGELSERSLGTQKVVNPRGCLGKKSPC